MLHVLPEACVFYAYGTLFDFASAIAGCEAVPAPKRSALNSLWRDKQLQYTWLRSLQGKHANFWQVTGDALDFALESVGLATPGLREKLMNLYRTLDTFPEVPGVLDRLKKAGVKTAILSNGTHEMLRAAIFHARIESLLDAVLSVGEVGVYKPHPKVYELAVDRLGLERHAIWFVSSNAWDAWAASAFGMRVVWCNRNRQRRERLPGSPEFEVRSLAELPFLASS